MSLGRVSRSALAAAALTAAALTAAVAPASSAVASEAAPLPGAATAPAPASLPGAAQPRWVCGGAAYLFQTPVRHRPPGKIYGVSRVSGVTSKIGTTPHAGVDAVGFNRLDHYMYGWDTTTSQLARIGRDGSLAQLGHPAGVPADAQPFNVGDFDSAGHLWVASTQNFPPFRWYEIDLVPGAADYGQVMAQGTLTPLPELAQLPSDWSFIGGAFYGLAPAAAGGTRLIKFDPAASAATDLGAVPGVPGGTYGATFADPAGHLFGSNNGTGRIYRVKISTRRAFLWGTGPAAQGNDGTSCIAVPGQPAQGVPA